MSNPASPLTAFRLETWACLRITGTDSETFLQGQLSADARLAAAEGGRWTSYNSAKGRMLAVAAIHRATDTGGFTLHLPAALAEPIARRLRLFVLRAQVLIEPLPPAATDATAAQDERRALIDAGVPVVYPETQDRWVAQMANLDQLGGISFDKGCYTGQEVVARLHYLGNLKKRMFRVQGTGPAPQPGTAIRNGEGDGQAVGEIVDAVADGTGWVASAVLQLSAAESRALRIDREEHADLEPPRPYVYAAAP